MKITMNQSLSWEVFDPRNHELHPTIVLEAKQSRIEHLTTREDDRYGDDDNEIHMYA